jgi:hypothetical protein
MISHSELINKSIETVWENFVFKIEHPEYFVPGVSDVIITEKNDMHTLREMNITSPDGITIRLKEKITHAPYWVKFLIIEHPIYNGYVDNIAEKISETETKITYTINWVNKKTGEIFSNQELVKSAVLKSIDYILKNN